MTSRSLWTSLFALVVAGALQQSCSPASYEFIKPKKDRSVGGNKKPEELGPQGPQSTDPTPSPAANIPPTARIETIASGISVTKVRAGLPVTIRPTADTLDPDDIGKSQCANPGIVKASYRLGNLATPTAARSLGCETLGVPYTFPSPGEYHLEMIVTSNENETAFASMLLTVVDSNAPITADGGFTIQAIPLLTPTGKDVRFYGYCETSKAHTIKWTYGDQALGEGPETVHAYATNGQYRVDATCTETTQGGRTWTAALTVVVIADGSIVIPGGPTVPTRPDGGSDGTDGSVDGTDGSVDGGNPGQGQPGQGEPGQGEPGQVDPGQVDGECGCGFGY